MMGLKQLCRGEEKEQKYSKKKNTDLSLIKWT